MVVDYNNLLINKFPVLIVSAPRTGSTTLAQDICNQYPNLKFFNELGTAQDQQSCYAYTKSTNNYLLKAHLIDICKYNTTELKEIFNDSSAFLIRLRRRNVLDQITSWYIELHRNIWAYPFYKYNQVSISDTIPLVRETVISAIDYISRCNILLDTCDYKFDLDLFYEDLNLTSNQLLITPKPSNHEEVSNFIKQFLLIKEDVK